MRFIARSRITRARRQQHVTVGLDSEFRVDEGDETASWHPRSRALEGSGARDLADDVGNGEKLASRRQAGRHSHVGEGAIDEIALVGEFRDGRGDRVVQAAAARSEFVDVDHDLMLECRLRDRLAEAP